MKSVLLRARFLRTVQAPLATLLLPLRLVFFRYLNFFSTTLKTNPTGAPAAAAAQSTKASAYLSP